MHSARCTAHARKDWVQLPIFMTAWHCKISTARWRLENLVLPFLLIPSLLGRIVLHRKSFINHYSATIFMIHKMGSKYSFMIGWWIFWMHSAWHFSFAVIVSEKNPSDRMLTASISRLVIFLGTEGWGRWACASNHNGPARPLPGRAGPGFGLSAVSPPVAILFADRIPNPTSPPPPPRLWYNVYVRMYVCMHACMHAYMHLSVPFPPSGVTPPTPKEIH